MIIVLGTENSGKTTAIINVFENLVSKNMAFGKINYTFWGGACAWSDFNRPCVAFLRYPRPRMSPASLGRRFGNLRYKNESASVQKEVALYQETKRLNRNTSIRNGINIYFNAETNVYIFTSIPLPFLTTCTCGVR